MKRFHLVLTLFKSDFSFFILSFIFEFAEEEEKSYWEKMNADRMSRYNSKREKKRGTEKVGILDLTDSILIKNVRNSFFALSVGFPNSNARTVLNLVQVLRGVKKTCYVKRHFAFCRAASCRGRLCQCKHHKIIRG